MPIDAGTAALTLLALLAFASNSILTRLALGAHAIDATVFTAVRLVSGAVALALLVRAKNRSWSALFTPGVVGPCVLFIYAVPFSLAYLRIGAAVGSLVLFGAVQFTMVAYAVIRGERPLPLAWAGLVLAMAGLGLLTLRSAERPDPVGTVLMMIAGVAWGAYTIVGRGTSDPIASNARSFLWSAPVAVVVAIVMHSDTAATGRGIVLALVSGAVTSGLGYAVWYRALPRLEVTQAAVAQLSVPVIAAVAAVVFLGESLSARLVLSGAAVLGGVALVLASRALSQRRRP